MGNLCFPVCGKELVSVFEAGADESRQTPDSQRSIITTKATTTRPKKAKKPWWRHFCRKTRRVSASPEEQQHSTPHQDKVVESKGLTEEGGMLWQDRTHLQAVPKEKTEDAVSATKTRRQQQIKCLGFPNPAQFCYMNSCLQSLLTLKDFVQAISCQEQVWGSIPDAALVRSFMDIYESHFSRNANHKLGLLIAFMDAIWSPEFKDLDQKDAHEFFTSVLDQMRCLSPELQAVAASMGRSYSCPVEDHMGFKMLNTRTCKSCGTGSTRVEEFTNFSLDLIPGGGSVEQMLENYLMEKEVEYKCDCGATTSGQRYSILTLPRVLVLHLKRFRWSTGGSKIHDPVVLHRDLVVSTNKTGGCYSLVSTINHIGYDLTSGHYICDGVDPDVGLEDPSDCWFTYNDAEVTQTSGDFVCHRRQKTSYILLYKRHD